MTAETKEAMEYLDGSIKNPDKPAIKPQIVMVMTASELIPWDYDKPTVSEWKAQNAWIKGLLIYNICNAIRLAADVLGTAERL